jgi:threonine dehydratase
MSDKQTLALAIRDGALAARERIGAHVLQTRLSHSRYFSQLTGAQVFFKEENLQLTGSFKARGAFAKLTALTTSERSAGVIAASTGNHGAAVAYAGRTLGIDVTVYVPESASPVKLAAIEAEGAALVRAGRESGETEGIARAEALRKGVPFVSPYNDWEVICGQGTIGLELSEGDVPLEHVYVALGGGGLVSGIAGAMPEARPESAPQAQVIAVSAEVDCVMHQSVKAGAIVPFAGQTTLADGAAGGLEDNCLTLQLCSALVDRYVLAPEAAIARALRTYLERESKLIEGAAAMALAGFLADVAATPERFKGRNVAVVLCGARIAPETLAKVLAQDQ